MADKELEFLDSVSEIHSTNVDAWRREERRLFGGDAAIAELAQWKNEAADHFTIRKNEASWLNFPKIHASTLAGHLGRVAPTPNFGTLGETVRSRKDARANPQLSELIYYNVDGIGADGSQWHAWMNGLQERAIATGHRWVLVEMPAAISKEPRTRQDAKDGHRPYLVEFSPVQVTCHEMTNGRLDWAVARIRVRPKSATQWEPLPKELGYYLFVRQGYEGLGDAYAGGGWWIYDKDKQEINTGDWSRTRGQIPLVPLIAETSQGTTEWPAMSRSLTMELGQIAVSLMNRVSERDYDASDAAKSVKYVLGADKDGFNLIVDHHTAGSYIVPVVGQVVDGKFTVPQIYDSSSGAIPAEVYTTIVTSKIAEAHEVMVRQVSSGEDASGVSRDKAFGEATSPLLGQLATRRETFENAILHFLELRAGAQSPSGFVTWPTEFELAPLLTKIERLMTRMQAIAVRSPTLEAKLLERSAQDDGLWPMEKDQQESVRSELLSSAKAAAGKAKAEMAAALVNAGADLESAARTAGFSEDEVATLVTGLDGDGENRTGKQN